MMRCMSDLGNVWRWSKAFLLQAIDEWSKKNKIVHLMRTKNSSDLSANPVLLEALISRYYYFRSTYLKMIKRLGRSSLGSATSTWLGRVLVRCELFTLYQVLLSIRTMPRSTTLSRRSGYLLCHRTAWWRFSFFPATQNLFDTDITFSDSSKMLK